MKCFVIAQVVNNYNLVTGYKLLDADTGETMVVNVESMKQVLTKQPDFIKNAALVNNVLTGTNGKLDRYAKVDQNGNLRPGEKSPLVVIHRIGEVGYLVSDFKGQMIKMGNAQAVEYAKNQGIANGKVVTQENIEFISSISDNYDVVELTASKAGANTRVNIPIHIGTDANSIAKHTAEDIQTEMEYNDVFAIMTDEQKNVLKQYYIWYTVDAYKKLAKNTRLDLAPGKAEKLAQLRGIDKWLFAGINDSHAEGNFQAHCELGHRLRYEYFAIPEDAVDENMNIRTREKLNHYMRAKRDTVQDLRDAGAIVFGETCAADFFDISPEDMKKLVKTRKTMSDEIELMSGILTNHLEADFLAKYKLLAQIIEKLGSTEAVIDVFGERVGYTMLAFMKAKMPFPMSLVILAGEQARKDTEQFWSKIFPNHAKLIHLFFNHNNPCTGLLAGLELLKFISEYTIEGAYQYDPVKDNDNIRKDIGRYNKETREQRDAEVGSLMDATSINVRLVTLETLEQYFENVEYAMLLGEEAKKVYNDSILSATYTSLKSLKKIIEDRVRNEYYNRISKSETSITNDEAQLLAMVTSGLAFNKDVQPIFYMFRAYGKSFSRCREMVFKKATISQYFSRLEAWRNTAEINEYVHKLKNEYGTNLRTLVLDALKPICGEISLDEKRDRYVEIRLKPECREGKQDDYFVAKLDYITFNELKDYTTKGMDYSVNTNEINTEIVLISNNEIRELREITEANYKELLARIIESREYAERIRKEQEEREKRQREIEERLEREKQEEILRLAEQQRLKAEQAAKKEMEDEAKLDKLRGLIEGCSADVSKSYGVQTAKAILNSGLIYSKMSPKQRWRIDTTLKELENLQHEEIDYDLDSVDTSITEEAARVKENNAEVNKTEPLETERDAEVTNSDAEVETSDRLKAKEDLASVFKELAHTQITEDKGEQSQDIGNEEAKDNDEEAKPVVKDRKYLSDNAEVSKMVKDILSKVDKKTEQNSNIRFAHSIAITVDKTGHYTEKQLKYLMRGYKELQ